MFRKFFSHQHIRSFPRKQEQNKNISRLKTFKKYWASSSNFYFFLYYRKYESEELSQDGKDMAVTAYIKSFFGPHFSKFGLNTDISGVNPKSPYSIQTWENASQKTSESGYFSCRECDSALSEKNNMLYFRSFVSPTRFKI